MASACLLAAWSGCKAVVRHWRIALTSAAVRVGASMWKARGLLSPVVNRRGSS